MPNPLPTWCGYTPGVTFDPVTKNISIRGVNSTAGDATTGIYIDDTPIQLRALGFGSDNTLPAMFDLERVEVLRGPQGTLFGAGSEGGTVRYITPTPSLTDFSVYGKTELSVTENGAPNYEGGVAIGGPIVDDKLGFRISAWGRRDGGWIDKVDYMTGATLQANSNYVNTYVVRGALLWQATPSLAITPSVFYQNRRQNNIDQYWVGALQSRPRRLQDRNAGKHGRQGSFRPAGAEGRVELGRRGTDLQHVLFRPAGTRAGLQRHALQSLLFPAIGRLRAQSRFRHPLHRRPVRRHRSSDRDRSELRRSAAPDSQAESICQGSATTYRSTTSPTRSRTSRRKSACNRRTRMLGSAGSSACSTRSNRS